MGRQNTCGSCKFFSENGCTHNYVIDGHLKEVQSIACGKFRLDGKRMQVQVQVQDGSKKR